MIMTAIQSAALTDRRHFLAGTAACSAMSALPVAARAQPKSASPFDPPIEALLELSPETATSSGLAAALDGGRLARRMDDYSPEGQQRWRDAIAATRKTIAAIRTEEPRSAIRQRVIETILEGGMRSAAIPYGRVNPFGFSGHVPYLVCQITGPHIDTVNTMSGLQSVATPAAVDAWIEKLDGFGTSFAGVIDKLRADHAAGVRPPRVLLDKTLPVLDAFIDAEASKHPMITDLAARMTAAGLSPELRATALKRAMTALDRSAKPAFVKLRKTVDGLRATASADDGVWAQPDGEALYAANVRNLGDTDRAPADIHRIGLDEVGRISSAMDALLKQQGLSTGSVGARMDAIAADPRNQFPDSDAGRAALLDYLRALAADAEQLYPQFLPEAMIPRQGLVIRRIPVATEAGAPGGYYESPSLDGSRPGTYFINLRDMKAVAKPRLPTLTYHEGVPGHHTQVAIAFGLGDAPIAIRIASFNAFQEGWALYAEQLMAELGAYRDNPLGDLGRLQDELFRAVRLVVDTGMHQLRWTREQAIAYMQDTTGIAVSRVTAEIERYMAWPAQALGYKLGQIRINELRDAERRRRGAAFSLPAFHATVIGEGSMPLSIVAERLAAS